jgi:hypothetical protein
VTRSYGIGVAVLGAVIGTMPFAGWYRADLPGRTVVRSGVEVSGELWTLPLFACVIVGIGVAIAVGRPNPVTLVARWLGGICAVAGAMCVGWALFSVFRITGVAVPVGVADGPPAPLRAQPAAFIAAAAGAAVTAVSLVWVRIGSD